MGLRQAVIEALTGVLIEAALVAGRGVGGLYGRHSINNFIKRITDIAVGTDQLDVAICNPSFEGTSFASDVMEEDGSTSEEWLNILPGESWKTMTV